MMIRSRLYLKVLGNFGFLLLILVAMTFLVSNVLNRMVTGYETAALDMSYLSSLDRVRNSLVEVPEYLDRYLVTGEQDAKEAFVRGWKDFDGDIAELKDTKDSLAINYLSQIRSQFFAWVEYVADPRVRLYEGAFDKDSVVLIEQSISDLERENQYLFTARSLLNTLFQRKLSSQTIVIESSNSLGTGLGDFVTLVNILFAVFAAALGFFLTRSLTKPLGQLKEGTRNIMESKFVPLNIERTDEFGELADDFNQMSRMLRENYTRIRSYSDLMTTLNENESLVDVLRKSLDLLSKQANAINGAFYIFNKETKRLELNTSYALRQERSSVTSFAIGEGIPGECARLNEPVEVTDMPNLVQYPVDTGLNSIMPKYAYACPVTFQDNLVGVLVLGSTTSFDEFTRGLIDSAAPQIGVAITNAQNFEATQALTEELTEKHTELNSKNAELERAYQVKSDFLSNMSHELRTPLNSIIGFTSILLSDRGDPMTNDQRKAMEKVLKNGKHLLQLINDILDFSKIESGRMHVSVESDSVENVVSSAITTAEHLIRQKGLELKEEMQSNLPMFQTDTLKVKQIIVNMLSNAAKFTDEGSITVRTWFEKDMVYVAVKDMGIGIEPQNISRVFEEFQQIDSSHSRKYKGTGLGLPISRRLARLLGGDLVCESVYGEGATFTLTVPPELPKSAEEKADVLRPAATTPPAEKKPAAAPAPSPAPKKEEAPVTATTQSTSVPGAAPTVILSPQERAELEKLKQEREKKKREEEKAEEAEKPPPPPPEQPSVENGQKKILCIDDEPDVIEILRNYLIPEGYAVFAAYSGAEGIKLAEEVNPNAITLDIMMPQKDGWQVLRELKANAKTRDIPVLIHSMIDNKPLAFSLGALDYLPKPAEPMTVLSLVNKAVKSKDKHVLLIDDDEEYREVLGKILGDEGFSVEQAKSGKEAMKKLREARPAMILLDIRMPEMDGFEFLRHLRQADQWKSIPVTILSGADLTDDQLTEVNKQMIDYVRKSDLTLDNITHTIKKVL